MISFDEKSFCPETARTGVANSAEEVAEGLGMTSHYILNRCSIFIDHAYCCEISESGVRACRSKTEETDQEKL